jgi:hypothetical protein
MTRHLIAILVSGALIGTAVGAALVGIAGFHGR